MLAVANACDDSPKSHVSNIYIYSDILHLLQWTMSTWLTVVFVILFIPMRQTTWWWSIGPRTDSAGLADMRDDVAFASFSCYVSSVTVKLNERIFVQFWKQSITKMRDENPKFINKLEITLSQYLSLISHNKIFIWFVPAIN